MQKAAAGSPAAACVLLSCVRRLVASRRSGAVDQRLYHHAGVHTGSAVAEVAREVIAAPQRVVAVSAEESVVTCVALQVVIAGTAFEIVVACVALQVVVAVATVDLVVARAA